MGDAGGKNTQHGEHTQRVGEDKFRRRTITSLGNKIGDVVGGYAEFKRMYKRSRPSGSPRHSGQSFNRPVTKRLFVARLFAVLAAAGMAQYMIQYLWEWEEKAATTGGAHEVGNVVAMRGRLANRAKNIKFLKRNRKRARVVSGTESALDSDTKVADGEFYIKPLFQRGEDHTMNGNPLCVVVRTYIEQRNQLKVQLASWDVVGSNAERDILVFIANTDSNFFDSKFIQDVVQEINLREVLPHLVLLPSDMRPREELYGYDVTQLVLEKIMASSQYNCSTYLFTNGDNYYHPKILIDTGLNGLDTPPAQLIGVDFVSHHPRPEHGEGYRRRNQVVLAEFSRGYIDLGAAFIDSSALEECPEANFHPQEDDENNFALDWFFFEALIECEVTNTTVPEVLFMHQ